MRIGVLTAALMLAGCGARLGSADGDEEDTGDSASGTETSATATSGTETSGSDDGSVSTSTSTGSIDPDDIKFA